MAKRQYTVEIEITAKDKAAKPITGLAKGAMTDLQKAGRAASLSLLEMAESLSKASKTDAARAALSQLQRVMESGELSFEDYRDAVDRTQQSFGLATPASKKLAGEISDLTNRLAKGDITADEYDKELRQLTKGLKGVDKAAEETSGVMKLMDGIMLGLGQQVVSFVQRLPGMVVDLVKLGAAVERQTNALDGLATAAGTSGAAIVAAIQESSNFTIDRMTAMQVANRALLLDVAKTPAEFERLTRVAVRLGQAMGLDATTAINDFVTAAGRQSVMIADNLGLTVKIGDATEKYAEQEGLLVDELTDAQRKQAFLNAMLESGEVKVAELGEATGETASDIEMLTAGLSDLKVALAETAAGATSGTAAFLGTGLRASALSLTVNKLQKELLALNLVTKEEVAEFQRAEAASRRQKNSTEELAERVKMLSALQREYNELLDEHSASSARAVQEQANLDASWLRLAESLKDNADEMAGVSSEGAGLEARLQRIDKAVADYNESWRAAEQIGSQAERGMEKLADGLNETGDAASWAEINAMKLAQSLAEAEAASITAASAALKMGMSWKTFFDRNEEQAQNWVTKREELETGHAERLKEIQDAGNTEMLAAEQIRYDEEKRMLDESQAAMLEAQKKQMGQMILQSFEAWATMKGIPADQMLKMRTGIAEEYGLIDAETANSVRFMTSQWEEWAEGTKLSTDDVIDNLGLYMEKTGLVTAEAGGHLETHQNDMAIWREALINDMSQVSTAMDEHKTDPRALADETSEDTKTMTDDWVAWKDSLIEGTGTVKGEMDGLITKSGEYSTTTTTDTTVMTEDWRGYREAVSGDIATMETAMGGAAVKTGEMATTSGEHLADSSSDWQEWEGSIGRSAAETVGHMSEVTGEIHGVKNALAELPREVRIQIVVEQQGNIPGLQGGARSFGGGMALVGEAGPELAQFPGGDFGILGAGGPGLVDLPRGTQIWPAGSGPSRTTNNNFNMTVNTRAPSSTVVQDFETMAALAA